MTDAGIALTIFLALILSAGFFALLGSILYRLVVISRQLDDLMRKRKSPCTDDE